MAFPRFPYTDFHRLNADWVLTKMREMVQTVEQYAEDLAHVVRVTAQIFNNNQKQQARENIGAASTTDLQQTQATLTTTRASLSTTQETLAQVQTTANNNAGAIGGLSAEVFGLTQDVNHLNAQHYVLYSEQSLDAEDKAQARTNIGAADASLPGAVRYDMAQNNLTAAQKQIARNNIDCPPQPPRITITMTGGTTGTYDATLFNSILSAAASGYAIRCYIVIPGGDPAYVPILPAYTSSSDPSAATSSPFILGGVAFYAAFDSGGVVRLYAL